MSPYPARIPWANPDGTLTSAAIRWLSRELFQQIGGTDGMSNAELVAALAALTTQVETFASAVLALTNRVETLEAEVEALIVGEQVFQPAPIQELTEMTFQ